MHLRDLIVLVTGGGSGIGLELSKQLVALGNTVFICGRRKETLDAAADVFGLIPIVGDVSNQEDQERILASVTERHGRLDLLINNAGVFGNYDFGDEANTAEGIEAEISINAVAPLTLAKRALPLLQLSEAPAILFIGSGVAYVPVASTPAYSGTKALIHHAAKALRHQLEPRGVSVFEALPPVVDTDMGRALKSKNLKVMQPEDLVAQILGEMQDGTKEIAIGQSKQLRLMSRLAPEFIFRQMAKTEFH
ncbi:MAG: SDR family NAD(P)-dependent oxidoreductase [Pseudomonadota bacterium]